MTSHTTPICTNTFAIFWVRITSTATRLTAQYRSMPICFFLRAAPPPPFCCALHFDDKPVERPMRGPSAHFISQVFLTAPLSRRPLAHLPS